MKSQATRLIILLWAKGSFSVVYKEELYDVIVNEKKGLLIKIRSDDLGEPCRPTTVGFYTSHGPVLTQAPRSGRRSCGRNARRL